MPETNWVKPEENISQAFEHDMHTLPEETNILFIGGLHRSGTSMIHRIIRQHPRISGFIGTGVPEDEGQHLQSIIPTAGKAGGPGRFCFNPKAAMDESHPLCDEQNAARLLSQWLKHWDGSKQILVEKSPPNLIRTRFLQGLFPKAHFLIIIRHPVAVAYATHKFIGKRSPGIRHLIRHSLEGYRIFARDYLHLHQVVVIRYEDFVRRPDDTLKPVYKSLGIEPVECREPIHGDVNRSYLDQWAHDNRPIRRLFPWKKPLVEADGRHKMDLLGYRVDDESVSASPPDLAALASLPD